MNDDNTYTITIDNNTYTNDTGSEYSYNTDYTTPSITLTTANDVADIGELSFDTTYTASSSYDTYIDPVQVENMCKEYPALIKVWQNFKTVYDMTLQDYKGKQKAGDINDTIPF